MNQLTTQQQAWLILADSKNTTVADLQNSELALQSILMQDQDISTKLKSYRTNWAALVDRRKSFTSLITDKLITPLMEFEKRSDPKTNELYKVMEREELQMRLEAESKQKAELEKAEFSLFVRNSYEQQCLEYRQAIWRERKAGGDAINVPIPALPKFQAKYITREDMAYLFDIIRKPDYETIRKEMEAEDVDIAVIEEESIGKQKINLIIADQEAIEVLKPKVKRNLALTATAENWQLIVSEFATGQYLNKVRVKDIAKLTVQQMATALADYATETGELIDGLNYQEVVK